MTIYYKLAMRQTRHNDMEWVAFAKVGPFHEPLNVMYEDDPLWFNFGVTGQEALDKVVAEVKQAGYEQGAIICNCGIDL